MIFLRTGKSKTQSDRGRHGPGLGSQYVTQANVLAFVFLLIAQAPVSGAIKTWVGGGGPYTWNTGSAWSPTGAPTSGDSVIFNGPYPCSLTTDVNVLSIVLAGSYTGAFQFGHATINVSGSTADFRSIGPIQKDFGQILFTGGAQRLMPPDGQSLPTITVNGSGTTQIMNGNLIADSIIVLSGTFDLGVSGEHLITGIRANGGGLNFNGSLAHVVGDVDLANLSTLSSGVGFLDFIGAAGTQSFKPKSGATHPHLFHSGPTTLRIVGASLTALSFSQTDGILDVNGNDVTTVTGGDFNIQNGVASSLTGIGGRTVTVNGNLGLFGASTNSFVINPGASLTLNVSGAVFADQVDMGNCVLTGSAGTATRSLNEGGNSGWTFPSGYYWNRSDVFTSSNDFNKAYNWNGTPDGKGFHPASVSDYDFYSTTLDAGWTFTDQDADAGTGGYSLTLAPHQLALSGRGSELFGPTNQFVAAYRSGGDGDYTVKVVSAINGKAGLITANSLSALSSGGYCALAFIAGQVRFEVNVSSTIGELNYSLSQGTGLTTPIWLRLVKNGGTYSAYYRNSPGVNWIPVGTPQSPQGASGSMQIGVFSLSMNPTVTATSLFDDFQTGGDLSGGDAVLSFNGTTGTADADATLSSDVTVQSVDFTGYTGAFNFGGHKLTIAGAGVNFVSGMSLTASPGRLEFNGGSPQSFTPKSGAHYGEVIQNGLGGTTLLTNGLVADTLTVATGAVNLGTGLTHSLGRLSSTGGGIQFGTSTMNVTGTVDFGGLSALTSGSGSWLRFTGSSTQTFIPANALLMPDIEIVASVGAVSVYTNALLTKSLRMTSGSLTFSNGTQQTGAILATGGSLDLGSSTLEVTSGDADLAGLSTLNGSGAILKFTAASGTQNFTPMPGTPHPSIVKTGGGILQILGNDLGTPSLEIDAGTVKLGAGLMHTLTNLSGTGALDFQSSTLQVSGSSVDMSGFASVVAGSGTLVLAAPSAQAFIPKSGATCPSILQTGNGTVTVNVNDLHTANLTLNNGTFDISTGGKNIFATGNLSLAGGHLLAGAEDVLIGGDVTVTSGTLDCPTSGNQFTIGGNFSQASGSALNPATGSIMFNGTATGKIIDVYGSLNALVFNGAGGGWTLANHNLALGSSLTITAGTFNISTHALNAATGDLVVNGGTLTATNGGLAVNGDLTLTAGTLTAPIAGNTFIISGSLIQSGGTLTTTSGKVQLTGNNTGKVIKTAATFDTLSVTGSGSWLIDSLGLHTGTLRLTTGSLNLGSGLTNLVSGSLDLAGGTLHFGSSNLQCAVPTVDFSLLGGLYAETGTLEFTRNGVQNFTPLSGVAHPKLKLSGTGTVSLVAYDVTIPDAEITAGAFNVGGRILSISNSLTISGGALNASSGNLNVYGNVSVTSGGLSLPSGGTCNFGGSFAAASGTLTPNSGIVNLTGTTSGYTLDVADSLYKLNVNGYGGEWTIVNHALNLNGAALNLQAGTLRLGSGLTHSVKAFYSASGTLDFGSSVLRVSANDANFSGLADVIPGTGSLAFTSAAGTQSLTPRPTDTLPVIVHSGGDTLALATYALICKSFTQSAGAFNLNSLNLTTVNSGDFSINNGNAGSITGLGGSTLTISGNASLVGASAVSRLNLNPGSAWTAAVTGTLTGNFVSIGNGNASNAAGTCSNCANLGANSNWNFSMVWAGGGSTNNWSESANWSGGSAPTSLDAVTFDGTSTKNVALDVDGNAKAVAFTLAYTGTFDFTTHTLSVFSGNADFRLGGIITPGSGTLAFSGSGAQTFIPKSGTAFPRILQNGVGTTTISTNNLSAADLTLASGTFHLGAGLTHSFVGISGGGGLNFGTSNINVSGSVDLSTATVTVGASNTLTFVGSSPQTYTPKAGLTGLNLAQRGGGGTTILGTGISITSLTITSGTLHLGTALSHTVTGAISLTSGSLDFGSSTLSLQSSNIDFTGLSSVTQAGGVLEFSGGTPQYFTPKAGAPLPDIRQNGAGGTTVLSNGFSIATLRIASGTLYLGSALTDSVGAVMTTGGGLDFGSSAMIVKSGGADFSGLATLTAGSGQLIFSESTGGQTVIPKSGVALPAIVHKGAGALTLRGGNLLCSSFLNQSGIFDFGGFNVTVAGTGAFRILNGTSATLSNLAGRTLTVGGNALFAGQPSNHLNMNPASGWTLAVTGTLLADNADIANCSASISAGYADSSRDLLGNANWHFLDSVPPANVSTFTATALNGHAVSLAWVGSSSADAESVMVRYRTDGVTPGGATDGVLWKTLPKSSMTDTATGLSDKTIFHFAAFVRDSSGNWSGPSTGAADSARTPDVTAPANVTAFTATAQSPSAVTLNWTPSRSPDVDSLMIRYRTDGFFPASITDGSLWKNEPQSRVSDTVTGLSGNIMYSFVVFVRDSAGNYSSVGTGAEDTALYQASVSGSVSINDQSSRTSNPNPALAFTYAGADSLRFSLLMDTGTASWKAVHPMDSLSLAGGPDGRRIVMAQFKNIFGTRSPWYRDTTLLDRLPPEVSVPLNATYGYRDWTGSISGKAVDTVSGMDTVFIVRYREADSNYFNGSAWSATADTAKLSTDSLFSISIPGSAMATGYYRIIVFARDRVGNFSAPMSFRFFFQDNRTPQLSSSDIRDSILQNQAVDWIVDLGDMDPGDSLATVSASLPPWITATERTDSARDGFAEHRMYRMKGMPQQGDVGNNSISITVRDMGGKTFAFAKTVYVVDVNDPPKFSVGQDSLGVMEDSVTLWTPKYSDPDPGDRHTFAILQAPPFVHIQDSVLTIHPGSRNVGKFPMVVTVSDGKASDTLRLTLTVINVEDPPVAFASDNWQSPAHWKEHAVDSFTVLVVDMDKGDPITLLTSLPAYIRYSQVLDTSGYNHFFKFTVTPGLRDTGDVKLKLNFADAAGKPTGLTLTGRVQPVNNAPVAVILSKQTQGGAARFAFDVNDSDGNLAATRFHYRLINSSGDTLRSGISGSPALVLHPIADGAYLLAVKAEDEGGLMQSNFVTSAFAISGATTLRLDSARWNMVAIPTMALPATALGAGATITSWDETTEDGLALGRYAAGKSVDTLKRGKGYWVRPAKPISLSAIQKDLGSGPVSIRLTHSKQGWNQIGNPFPYFVDVSAWKFLFWEWDPAGRDLVEAKGILKPWTAYWVQVAKDTILTLKDQPYFPGGSAPLAKSGAQPVPGYRQAGDWALQLSLQAGPYRDQANLLGVRSAYVTPELLSGATQEIDHSSPSPTKSGQGNSPRSLVADAPKFGDFIALHFEKPGEPGDSALGYAEDFRAALDQNEEWWDFAVENSGTPFVQSKLFLPGLAALQASGQHVFLVNRGVAQEVLAEVPATLAMPGNLTHYSLVVTPHGDFAEKLKANFNISQNFPNPVTDITIFNFNLPQAWDKQGRRMAKTYRVRLDVFDFSGRLAGRALDKEYKPGSYSLQWIPKSTGGGALAKGAYVYRLETPEYQKAMKMLVK